MVDYWSDEARDVLKSILKRKNIQYTELTKRLKDIGVKETPGSISNKLNRGTFSFSFFLQCMKALGIEKINLD